MMMDFFAEYGDIVAWIGFVSGLAFVLSLLIIPWVVCRLESHFFLHIHEPVISRDLHPLVFITLRALRYFFGILLLLAGILMLFLPGQGILTIILGASLLDFPGKPRAVDALLRNPSVQKSLNWIRKKGHKPPFSFAETHQ